MHTTPIDSNSIAKAVELFNSGSPCQHLSAADKKVYIHKKICAELSALYERKNHDYGDAFHLSYIEEGMAMPRIRLGDKFNRFKTLTKGEKCIAVKDESIRDTLLDLANYAIMTIMELEGVE